MNEECLEHLQAESAGVCTPSSLIRERERERETGREREIKTESEKEGESQRDVEYGY